MSIRKIISAGILTGVLYAMFGCSVAGRLQRHRTTASLSQLTRAERQQRQQDYRPQVVKLQRDSNTFYLTPWRRCGLFPNATGASSWISS